MAERLVVFMDVNVGIQLDAPLSEEEAHALMDRIFEAACGGCTTCGGGVHCESLDHDAHPCLRIVSGGARFHDTTDDRALCGELVSCEMPPGHQGPHALALNVQFGVAGDPKLDWEKKMADAQVGLAPDTKLCPACGRKGLHHPMHPDWYGAKDVTRLECRFCRKQFRVS